MLESNIDRRYEVIDTRAGGMGQVLICKDTTSAYAPRVVLKTLIPPLLADEDARRRFLRETEHGSRWADWN